MPFLLKPSLITTIAIVYEDRTATGYGKYIGHSDGDKIIHDLIGNPDHR